MVWAAIGSTVVGGVLSKVLNKKQSPQQQVQNTPGAAVSDPFASQRAQYQPQLQAFMGRASSPSMQFIDYSGGSKTVYNTGGGDGKSPMTIANSPLSMGQRYGNQQAQTVPAGGGGGGGGGDAFNPDVSLAHPTDMRPDPADVFNDPSYNFRVSQGEAALSRNAARGGMIGSGNQMAELMTYGQDMATQEYDKIFQRGMGVHQQEQADFNSTFNRGLQLHGQQEADYSNEFNRLALLSGANTGSPASAGQLVNQQAAQNQNATNAFTGKVVDAAGNLVNTAMTNWMAPTNQSTANPYVA